MKPRCVSTSRLALTGTASKRLSQGLRLCPTNRERCPRVMQSRSAFPVAESLPCQDGHAWFLAIGAAMSRRLIWIVLWVVSIAATAQYVRAQTAPDRFQDRSVL